jgi:hypothetical protein
MKILDPAHTFYRPVWVRGLIVAFCGAWTAVEALVGDPFFMVIMGALTVYTLRVLFMTYKLPLDVPETAVPDADVSAETKPGEKAD